MARTADPALRGRLLAAARAIFAERGYAAARISDIAARAGVAVGTIYLYFKTKEDIVGALCNASYQRVTERVMPFFADPDLGRAIDHAVDAAFECYAEEKDVLRLIYLNIGLGQALQMIGLSAPESLAGPFIERIKAGMVSGEVRRYDDIGMLLDMISNAFDQSALMHFVFNHGELDAHKHTLKQFVKGALLKDASE